MAEIEADGDSIESTASLLMRARDGDAPAREQLTSRYLGILGRWAHGRVPRAARDLVDTDDLVQSALVRALNNLDRFEPRGEGAFLAYLRQILLNKIRDQARRARRRPEHVELEDASAASNGRSPLEEAIGQERLRAYEEALAQLGESQREAVILRIELGMRYREIAEALSTPTANSARALVGRALVNLARIMKDHHEPA
ncbi:MAG: RNA polymerase sigma factor [Candidatus Eiseniibacteriota bacterium]